MSERLEDAAPVKLRLFGREGGGYIVDVLPGPRAEGATLAEALTALAHKLTLEDERRRREGEDL